MLTIHDSQPAKESHCRGAKCRSVWLIAPLVSGVAGGTATLHRATLNRTTVIPRLHDPANVQQTSSIITYSSKLPADVQQISSKRQAVSTCILNTFAESLLDRVNGVLIGDSSLRRQLTVVTPLYTVFHKKPFFPS